MKRAGYYYENWEEMAKIWVQKARANAKSIDDLIFDDLPEMVDESLITNYTGVYPSYHLINNYLKLLSIIAKAWQYHMEVLNLGYASDVLLTDFCQAAFPGISSQSMAKFTAGLEFDMFKPDMMLRELAKLAIDLQIDTLILESRDWNELEEKLKRGVDGKRWLDDLESRRDPWFYMMVGSGLAHDQPCWNDDLNIPLNDIRRYVKRLRNGENLDPQDPEIIKKERDVFTEKYRNLLNTDEDKRTFERLVISARRALPIVENHGFWIELQHFSRMNQKVRDIGRIFVKHGILGEQEDVWYMHRLEVLHTLQDLINAWGTGTKPAGTWYWPPKIERRKELMRRFKEWSAPTMLGALPEKITEPFIIGLWGVTNKSIRDWAELESGGKINEIKGFPASAGVAEGMVRVIRNPSEIDQVKKGEVLVCPTTSPNWGPAFGEISACVTDIGGIMSHAALVCRNFDLPAVTGTGAATKFLKTGDRVRVDGSKGLVTKL